MNFKTREICTIERMGRRRDSCSVNRMSEDLLERRVAGLVLVLLLAACSSASPEEATSAMIPSPTSGCETRGDCVDASDERDERVSPRNGKQDGTESDVDCGGSTGPKCAAGKTCLVPTDCASEVCTTGTCQAPTGTDGTKNGDESDIDCGGTTTGAPRCAVSKNCKTSSDCESGGCGYQHTCVEARSCTAHLGGDTCGRGEVGSGEEQHESCCRSLPVPNYADSSAPEKTVYLDKYEVTAGRVRTFLMSVTQEYGRPDVKRWIAEHTPTQWQSDWNTYLPSDTSAAETPKGNVGTNFAFGAAEYVHVHGQNCFQGAKSWGYPTYWYPPDVMQNENGGLPRVATQEQLDVKAMTCIPNAVLAAFCAWDGGELATAEVLDAVTSKGSRLAAPGVANISSDSGSISPNYFFPNLPGDPTHEGIGRIAAPGRIPADAVSIDGSEPWMDLRGNLNEVARTGTQFALLYQGIGYSSARAAGNDKVIPLPYYKAAYSGGRCMRIR